MRRVPTEVLLSLNCDICGELIDTKNPKSIIHCLVCDQTVCRNCNTYGCCPDHFSQLPSRTQKIFVETGNAVEKKSYHWKIIGLPLIFLFCMLLYTVPRFNKILLPMLLILFLFEWFNWNVTYISQYRRKCYLNNTNSCQKNE
jgi:hypothetical protein